MQSRLPNYAVIVHKLRKFLGIEKSSEGFDKLLKKSKAEQARQQKVKVKRSQWEGFTLTKP